MNAGAPLWCHSISFRFDLFEGPSRSQLCANLLAVGRLQLLPAPNLGSTCTKRRMPVHRLRKLPRRGYHSTHLSRPPAFFAAHEQPSAPPCERAGFQQQELHHVRHLSDSRRSSSAPGPPPLHFWEGAIARVNCDVFRDVETVRVNGTACVVVH